MVKKSSISSNDEASTTDYTTTENNNINKSPSKVINPYKASTPSSTNGYNNHDDDVTSGYVRKSRRTNSMDRVNEIQGKEKRQRQEQPDRPCHRPQDSLLSSSSGWTNYRGIVNLIIILLVLSNGRVALENILKYGILVDPSQWILFLGDLTVVPSVQIILLLNVFILTSLWTEKYLLATGVLNEFLGRVIISINMTSLIVVPAWIVWTKECHPVGSSMALFWTSVYFLKLISYHMVNFWCRRDSPPKRFPSSDRKIRKLQKLRAYTRSMSGSEANLRLLLKSGGSASSSDGEDNDSKIVQYPGNLNLKDMYYYVMVPTLCYELNFPQSQRIRKRFLIRRALEMIFLAQLMLGLTQQWILPTVFNSVGPLTSMNYPKMFERLLKLAIPNHIIWLIGFYWLFHSCLNFWAEVLRFADRQFYRDWWNSCSVQYFWSNWNIPVHKWCLRHLYKPMLSYGVSKFQASVAVFFVSAFFHEYLVSVPLKMFRIWAFLGMLVQIPFGMFVAKFHEHPQWANTLVWLSLILGQPLAILMYCHDYLINNHLIKTVCATVAQKID